jgi:hypothetical protein
MTDWHLGWRSTNSSFVAIARQPNFSHELRNRRVALALVMHRPGTPQSLHVPIATLNSRLAKSLMVSG